MKLNKIKSIIILTIVSLSFIACGDGGSDASFTNTDSTQNTPIDIVCEKDAEIKDYIKLASGDVIVEDDNNATIKIYHDINGTKRVCLISGKAYIIRK